MSSMMNEWTLSLADYLVFAASLLISACIGLYHWWAGRNSKTTSEFLLGSGQISVWPVSISLMASFMSAITLLGVPAENYSYSTQFFIINISYALGTPIAVFVFLPVFYQAQAASAYEYLERRFNPTVRRLASLVFILQMILYQSIVLYAPALALAAVTGLSKWTSILSVGLICTLYTSMGGIKAVVWTDLFQSALMFAAMILIIVKGTMEVGGLDEVWARAYNGSRIQFDEFSPDPTVRHSVWSLAFGGIFIYISLYGVSQIQVQRLLTVNSLFKAQCALVICWPVTTLLSLVTCFSGVVMYAYFWKCDPLSDPTSGITASDQLLPYFMMRILSSYQGLPGLFIAGIFSAALSSVSSFVNSLAAVTLEDFLRPALRCCSCWGELKESRAAFLSKLLAVFFGVLCIALTYVVEQMSGILQASLTIFGLVGGPLLGLFTLGMCTRSCNSTGALIGFLTSLSLAFWIGFGSISAGIKPRPLPVHTSGCTFLTVVNATENVPVPINDDSVFYLYRISYMWYASLSWLVELVVGLVVSWLVNCFQDFAQQEVNEDLLAPFLRTKRSYRLNDEHSFQEDEMTTKSMSIIQLRKLSKTQANHFTGSKDELYNTDAVKNR